MRIELSSDRQAWVSAEIAAGNFPSVEVAIETALSVYEHHLSALRAALDPALAALERGEGREESTEAFLARMHSGYPQA